MATAGKQVAQKGREDLVDCEIKIIWKKQEAENGEQLHGSLLYLPLFPVG